jgi:hypothetical protein
MAVLNSGLQTAWTPEDYGKLLDIVLAEKSIAFRAGTVISTGSESIRFPKLTADPAVAWTAENTQISLDRSDHRRAGRHPEEGRRSDPDQQRGRFGLEPGGRRLDRPWLGPVHRQEG